MAESRVLVAAPWGSPFRWHRVKYSLASLGFCGEPREAESRTSLEAVVAACKPTRTLIVVSDTLSVDAVKPEHSRCSGCPNNPETARIDPASLSSYQELVSRVRERVEQWISCCAGGLLAEQLKAQRLVVEVVPGFGFYAGWRFGEGLDNPLSSYTGEVAAILLRELLDSEPDTVVVDLTHGINYMPVAFYQAALIATHAYTTAARRRVKLVFVNSEPVIGPGEHSRIHVVNQIAVSPGGSGDNRGGLAASVLEAMVALDSFREQKVRPVKIVRDAAEAAEKVGMEMKKLTESALEGIVANSCEKLGKGGAGQVLARLGRAAARITLYSMPLAAVYLASCISPAFRSAVLRRVVEWLSNAREARDKMSAIDARSKSVKHGLAFDAVGVRLALYAAALLDYVAGSVGDRLCSLDYTVLREEGVTLSALKEVIARLDGTYSIVAENELDKLGDECVGDGDKCPIRVERGRWPGEKCMISSMDKRNLRAHAGLERNIIEGRVDEGELRLRYRVDGGDCGLELLRQLGKPEF